MLRALICRHQMAWHTWFGHCMVAPRSCDRVLVDLSHLSTVRERHAIPVTSNMEIRDPGGTALRSKYRRDVYCRNENKRCSP